MAETERRLELETNCSGESEDTKRAKSSPTHPSSPNEPEVPASELSSQSDSEVSLRTKRQRTDETEAAPPPAYPKVEQLRKKVGELTRTNNSLINERNAQRRQIVELGADRDRWRTLAMQTGVGLETFQQRNRELEEEVKQLKAGLGVVTAERDIAIAAHDDAVNSAKEFASCFKELADHFDRLATVSASRRDGLRLLDKAARDLRTAVLDLGGNLPDSWQAYMDAVGSAPAPAIAQAADAGLPDVLEAKRRLLPV